MEPVQKTSFSIRKMLLVSAAVLLFTVFASWIWRPTNTEIPTELIGEWRTSDPNYGDRSFEIDPVSVNFRTGEGSNTTGFIKRINAVQVGARTLYTIAYATDDSVNQVSFYYETAKGKIIRFQNQESIVWTKD